MIPLTGKQSSRNVHKKEILRLIAQRTTKIACKYASRAEVLG